MSSFMHRVYRFFFSFPPRPGKDPVLERIKLLALYGLVLVVAVSILIIQFIIGVSPHVASYFAWLTSGATLIALWYFRSTRAAGLIISACMAGLMAIAIYTGGGPLGFSLMHGMMFPIFLYFFLGLGPTLILTALYYGAFLASLVYFPFPPGSVFTNPDYAGRLAITALIIIAGESIFIVAFELMIRHLSGIALLDLGTGLPNHRSLQNFITEKIDVADRQGSTLSLVALRVLDMPRMETIYGTAAVETMVTNIGQMISDASGNACIVGRWKSNMFMAVYADQASDAIAPLMEAARTLQYNGNTELVPAVAAARCRYPEDAASAEALLSGTVAMLEVPTVEDGDILFPDRDWTEREAVKRALVEVVGHKRMDAEFKVRYQPKIRLRDRTCAGAEALLRWSPPGGKPIPPDIFIPLAEEAGLISNLTRWVIGRVFADHAAHAAAFGAFGVPPCSVNLSLHDLRDQSLMNTIDNAIAETGCKPEWIEFEITERLMVAEDPRVKASLDELYAAGFRIFIDDFGTGYSSLSYLHRLRTHGLKLDRSFLPAPEGGAVIDYPVVNAILSMSAALNLAVTAEGVETEEQAEYLSRRGCDLAQGWLFSRDLEFIDYINFHIHWTPSRCAEVIHEAE